MAENLSSPKSNDTQSKDKIWFDSEEFAIRKRLPPSLPKRPIDIYVSSKTSFKTQLDRIFQFFEKPESEFFIHAVGSCIPLALTLALRSQEASNNNTEIKLETTTSTVQISEDFEPVLPDKSGHQKNNSAIHIRVNSVKKVKESPKTVSSKSED